MPHTNTKTSDGLDARRVVVSFAKASSYTGQQTIGTTAVSFTWPTGANSLDIKVTHATQTIQVGQGANSTESDSNSALAIEIDKADSIIHIERMGSSAANFSLLGSGAGTTCTITVKA